MILFFSSKLFDERVFRQCAQSTKCHFDEVTFRRNGSLDEVSFDEVSHFILYNVFRLSKPHNHCTLHGFNFEEIAAILKCSRLLTIKACVRMNIFPYCQNAEIAICKSSLRNLLLSQAQHVVSFNERLQIICQRSAVS